MALAPLWVSIRTTGAAALTRLGATFRALGTRLRAFGARMAAAGRLGATFTAIMARLSTALRRVAVAALAAARAIGGPLVRALRAAVRAAGNLLQTLGMFAARFALMGALGVVALVPLVGIAGNLLGGIQLLAPAVVAAAAAFATWKLATRGFADALRADDAEELEEALKKLSPSAKSAALTLRDLGREWKSTQQKVQEAFFKGARQDFIMLSRAMQAIADRWLPKLAASFANLRMWMSQVFTAAAESGQLDTIMAGVKRFVDGIAAAIPYLTQAFLDIAEVAAPSFGDLGDKISETAKKFADWIRKLKEDGTLAAWLEKAKATFRKVMDIGKEIAGIFADIFKGTDGGGDVLTNLKNSIKELREWLQSDNGKEFIAGFLRGAEALANLVVWIGRAADAFAEFRDWLNGIGDRIQGIFATLSGAATAMFTVFGGGVAAFGWIAGVITQLGGLVTAVQGAVRSINTALSMITRTVFIDIITRHFGGGGSQGWAKPITGGGSGGARPPKFYASGGILQRGRLAVVGERGPEFVTLGATSRIYSNADSRAMIAGSGGGDYWAPAPTNANRDILRALEKAQRRRVRSQYRGSAQNYLAAPRAL